MEQKKTLLEIEKELYLAYGEQYGYGHSATRQFVAFLMNGPRKGEVRGMLAAAKDEVQQAAKTAAPSAPGVGANVFPAKSPSQPLQPPKAAAPTLPEPLPEPTQPDPVEGVGDVVVADNLRADILAGLSNVQIAAKYDRNSLVMFALSISDIQVADMSEKQIVAAIKKAMSK